MMSLDRPPRPESIELIGGHPALDLVNTVSWRHDAERRTEHLATSPDLVAWFARLPHVDAHRLAVIVAAMNAEPETAQRVLREVRELREALYRHIARCIDDPGDGPSISPGTALHRAFTGAVTAASLTGAPSRWALEPREPRDLTRFLALQALDLVQTAPRRRLGRCEDDGCGWLFLDTTRNHSRRWCSSSDCGNRDRARRHYARRSATSEPAPTVIASGALDPQNGPGVGGRVVVPEQNRGSRSAGHAP